MALVTLLALPSGGVSSALVMAGVYGLVVAVIALARGKVRWAHLTSRAAGGVALVGALVAMTIGGATGPAEPVAAPAAHDVAPSVVTPSTTATTAPTPTATPTETGPPTTSTPPRTTTADPVSGAIAAAKTGTALAVLGTLAVKGRGPMTGYSRAVFGAAWTDTDRNGCDQRNDTLRRDLKKVTLKAGTHGCTVLTGTLADPYTAKTVAFARTSSSYSPVQIDHVVPLADAWVKGAARWDPTNRTTFANDALNLVAVGASINAQKGAGDAATWLPPNKGYRCAYVARQVAVKAKYHLAVTKAERAAIAKVLGGCPNQTLPTAKVAKLGGWPLYQAPAPKVTATPAPDNTPAPKPAAPKPQAPAPIQGVHPGSFCSSEGALGYTNAGTLMRCSYKVGDPRLRWRSAG